MALVLMPEGPAFRTFYPADAWRQIRGFVDTLKGEYGIPIVNARDWMAEEDFLDSHHLLPSAATVFSERLGQAGILPLVRQHPRTGPSRLQDAEKIAAGETKMRH